MPTYLSAATTSEMPLLKVDGLSIKDSQGRTLVSDVGFEVREGEAISIVGESGSGKSLTARSIIGLLPQGLQARGSIQYQGREVLGLPNKERAALRGAQICMILQDPFTMLHPMLRCGNIITENLRNTQGRKLSKSERRAEAVRRLAEVGIHDKGVVDRFPSQLSGGMRQRVGIAAALAQDPKLLIADEPSTALDASTQFEVLALLHELQQSRGMALMLITHDLSVAFSVAENVNVLYAGSIMESGHSETIRDQPLHPYSLGLMMADPPVDRKVKNLIGIPGSVPDADSVANQCAFAARCEWAQPECRSGKPALVEVAPGHSGACIRQDAIVKEMRAWRQATEQVAVPLEPVASSRLLTTDKLEVTFHVGSKKANLQAVKDVSITVGEGESVGIVGESGSGKTTLSRAIVGLNSPSGGSIMIDGIDASDYRRLPAVSRRNLRRTVQMVFQDPYSSLNPVRSIEDTLLEAAESRMDGTVKNTEVGFLLDKVGLPRTYGRRMPAELSGGERQRVAIARAIALRPKLLICDEPVSALDVSVQAQILTLLRDLRDELGLAYLFITHDLAVVRQIADRLYVMRNGQVIEEGETNQVLDQPSHDYTRMLVTARSA